MVFLELQEDDVRSSGYSSPESTGSIETSISSHFGGMNYPSLFILSSFLYILLFNFGRVNFLLQERSGGSRVNNPSMYEGYGSLIREEPPPYTSPERYDSFEKPLAGHGSHSFQSQDDDRVSSGNPQFGTALYDFTAGGDDELGHHRDWLPKHLLDHHQAYQIQQQPVWIHKQDQKFQWKQLDHSNQLMH
ncbi:hypothetical protein GQ457_11G019800 [Hibiscus cannabinus]